jgi:hypothetical protein
MLHKDEMNSFKCNGAVLIKGKFSKEWTDKLRKGIDEDISNPSPRLVRHTKNENAPGYFEDFWT